MFVIRGRIHVNTNRNTAAEAREVSLAYYYANATAVKSHSDRSRRFRQLID